METMKNYLWGCISISPIILMWIFANPDTYDANYGQSFGFGFVIALPSYVFGLPWSAIFLSMYDKEVSLLSLIVLYVGLIFNAGIIGSLWPKAIPFILISSIILPFIYAAIS